MRFFIFHFPFSIVFFIFKSRLGPEFKGRLRTNAIGTQKALGLFAPLTFSWEKVPPQRRMWGGIDLDQEKAPRNRQLCRS